MNGKDATQLLTELVMKDLILFNITSGSSMIFFLGISSGEAKNLSQG